MNIAQATNLFSYAQKKKDSVQAVLIQLHSVEQATNYPNYIGLVKYFQSSIGGWDLMSVRNTYAVQHSNLVNDVHSVDCLALRFSDLSFFSQASITHDEKLEFSRFTLESISSSNSCGNLIPLVVDLLFLYPVAIYRVSLNWCRNTIQGIFQFKILDVFIHLDIRCLYTLLCSGVKIATPRSARNTIEAFNQNVIRGNTMAMYKSTQTHPKFKWRFFSCQQSKYFSVEATSEQEARSMLPDSPCLFSARIRKDVAHG